MSLHRFNSALPREGCRLNYAAIGPIATYFPQQVETVDQLREKFPNWDVNLIYEKTGVRRRHIAAADEMASDLGVAAARRLFEEHQIDPQSIDFLLLCTQSPDYPIPTTACLMQKRLGLPTRVGALDFNLGCSGFVYGLALAQGLIAAGSARRVLLITAETYSKYIDPADRSLRTIFGDAAAATVVDAVPEESLGPMVFGTDGSGADMLMLTRGGFRPSKNGLKPRTRHRWPSDLYMDGPGLIYFTLENIPPLVEEALARSGWSRQDVELFLMHQPTRMLMQRLRAQLKLGEEECPLEMEDCGNTVSSTIPILIQRLRQQGRLQPGMRTMLVGFGVGLSWAACTWIETWDGTSHRLEAMNRASQPSSPPA